MRRINVSLEVKTGSPLHVCETLVEQYPPALQSRRQALRSAWSDWNTNVGSDLLTAMNSASEATKSYVFKTAVLGVTGMKRRLADLLTALTGQPLKYFDDIESAKNWLVEE